MAALSTDAADAWLAETRVMRLASHLLPSMAASLSAHGGVPEIAAARDAERTVPPRRDARGRALSRWDQPMALAWPARRVWNAAAEDDFARFVTAIGRGVTEGRCGHLDECLASPVVNPLVDDDEMRLRMLPDCADVAYVLRAYFAFKRQLPFGFVAAMGGEGGDPRYLHTGRPVLWRQWTDFRSPRALFDEMRSYVHSGMFRLSPKLEDGDTYAARIDRASVRPGAVYYDTDGHVLVVTEVLPTGDVQFIDGHPGGSLTHPRFHAPAQTPPGSPSWGGGFRRWRPQRLDAQGVIVRARNAELTDFAPFAQYDRRNWRVAGDPAPYDVWVRDALRFSAR